ncbi:MAG TPA: vancomycin resistance protein, partial [Bacillaceae bacterium]
GGYLRQNTICRRKYNRQNQLVADDYITENQAIMMYEPLLPGS